MKIEEFAQIKIIFMRRTGAYGAENAKLMTAFKNWLKTNHLFTKEAVILGIAQDNPAFTEPENCRYDVALIVQEFELFSESDIRFGEIQKGRYAVFTIEHTAKALNQAWKIIPDKILETGYLIDNTRPILERYSVDMVNNHLCEICVPISQ